MFNFQKNVETLRFLSAPFPTFRLLKAGLHSENPQVLRAECFKHFFCSRCWEKVKHILPKGGLMVIYYGKKHLLGEGHMATPNLHDIL